MGWITPYNTKRLLSDVPFKEVPVTRRVPNSPTYDRTNNKWISGSNFTQGSILQNGLALTGVGSLSFMGAELLSRSLNWLGDATTNGGWSEVKKQALLNSQKDNPVSAITSDKFEPSQLQPVYNDDNSPALLAGTMQSAEMVSLSIGSLTQVLYDSSNMLLDAMYTDTAAKMQISYDLNNTLSYANSLLESLVYILADASQRSSDSASAIATAVGSIPATQVDIGSSTVNNVVDLSSIAPHLETMAQYHSYELERKKTPVEIKDSDGEVIANMNPDELANHHYAQSSKFHNDHNTVTFDDDDFNPNDPSGFIFPVYYGRNDLFNPEEVQFNRNPFMPLSQ